MNVPTNTVSQKTAGPDSPFPARATPASDGTNIKSKMTHVPGRIPPTAFIIVFAEFCERFAYYGASNIFANYLEHPPQTRAQLDAFSRGNGTLQPGALGKGRTVAMAVNQFFHFFVNVTPVLGGYISDQFWGKFKTIFVFAAVYLVGWCLLTASAYPFNHEQDGTPVYTDSAFIGFIFAISIIGIGAGCVKACINPALADEIPKHSTTKRGKTKIVDYELTIQRVYQYFYWAINLGSCLGQPLCILLERVQDGFWKAYLLTTTVFAAGILVLISARRKYASSRPRGLLIRQVVNCLCYARRQHQKYKTTERRQGCRVNWICMPATYILGFLKMLIWTVPRRFLIQQFYSRRHTVQVERPFAFLDYAKPRPDETQEEFRERTWDSQFPEDIRQMLKACVILAPISVYFIVYNQTSTSLISQAGQMRRARWLSNDLMNLIDPLVVIILIPLFDRVIYPTLQKRGIDFSYITRITFGFFFGALAMGWSAMVQHMIYHSAPYYNHPLVDDAGNTDTGKPNEISVWWQVPAYVLIAISESTCLLERRANLLQLTRKTTLVMASISLIQYAYTHSPKEMTSIVSALTYMPNAVAGLLGIALSPMVEDPHMTTFFVVVAIATFITGIWFFMAFSHFDEDDRMFEHVDDHDLAVISQVTLNE